MKTMVLEPINDRQEVFDVTGDILNKQGYAVTRENDGDTLYAVAGTVFLRRRIALRWSREGIFIEVKGAKSVTRHDVALLTETLDGLRTVMLSGQFTDGHRVYNYSKKHY